MKNFTRKEFMKTGAGLIGAALLPLSVDLRKRKPLLSFSTLGCPDWSYPAIINFAATNDYDGIELRGLQREIDLTKCKEFNSRQNILASVQRANDKGIKIIALGSSANLHNKPGEERRKNLDEAKKFIDLANQLNCSRVRVFPNNLPKEVSRDITMELIADGLNELGNYTKGSKVYVLMETHGEIVWIDDIKRIMEKVHAPNTGLVWDIHNMWSVTKESPVQAYEVLKTYIRHTHVKDSIKVDGKEKYTLPGKGESPVLKGIAALRRGGYNGYYSLEWEKMWIPDLEDPEIIFPEYPKIMRTFFSKTI